MHGNDQQLDLATLRAFTGRAGVVDVACPLCGPSRRTTANQSRKVLRIWDDGEFVTYKCARCETSGWAIDGDHDGRRHNPLPPKKPKPQRDNAALARFLWSKSELIYGTLAETYLQSRLCFVPSHALRFLPGTNDHPPSMLARFGSGSIVSAVHITKLRADGLGKARSDCDKITLGPSVGVPIIVHDNPERGELIVAEGIEDAASFALTTGWTAWAAGTANRIAPVLTAAAAFEKVYVAIDDDRPIPILRNGRIAGYRPGAAQRALQHAQSIRPDLIPVRVWKALAKDDAPDANAALIKYGRDALLAAIEWSEAQASYSRGEIGFHAMQALTVRADGIFRTIAETSI